MKCNYKNICESKKPDGSCGATILGYCDYQKEQKPEEIKIEKQIKKVDTVSEINYFDVEG